MNNFSHIYRYGISLAIAIFLFELIVYTLEKTGVPRLYGVSFSGVCLVVLWGICVFKGSTTSSAKFFLAGNSARSTINALAMTSCLGFPLMLVDGGSIFLSNPSLLVVLVVSTTLGVAFSGILISRHFRESGAGDISQLLALQYQSSAISRIIAMIIIIVSFLIGLCGLGAVVQLTSWFFAVPVGFATLAGGGAVLLTALLGGATSTTRLAATATTLIIVALTLPLIYHSASIVGFPVGQITFGVGALVDSWDLELQLKSLGIPILSEVLMPLAPLLAISNGQAMAAGLVIAAGTAFYPALVQQYSMTPSEEFSSRSAGKAIVFSALVGLSVIALLSYTKFGFYQTSLGLPLSEARVAAPFLYSWGGRSTDLITLCGQVLQSEQELFAACGGDANHLISIQDFTLNGSLTLAAAPDLAALPFSLTALLASSIILVLISFTAMALLSGATNLSSAIYAKQPDKVASARIFLTRLIVFVITLGAMYLVSSQNFDSVSIFLVSMSILASTIGPALICALRLPKLDSAWTLSAIFTGLIISILYFILAKYGVDLAVGTKDELRIVLPGMNEPIVPELSAIFALPVALLVLAIGTLAGDFSNNVQAKSQNKPS